jgi:hypothetical protein
MIKLPGRCHIPGLVLLSSRRPGGGMGAGAARSREGRGGGHSRREMTR